MIWEDTEGGEEYYLSKVSENNPQRASENVLRQSNKRKKLNRATPNQQQKTNYV